MKQEIRTFVAIKIVPGKKITDQLNRFKRTFRNERINWVDNDNFHLTLRFLGNTTREQLYQLVDGLEEVARDLNSFDLDIKGTGYFKSKGQPRVLFVKIRESESLSQLALAVEECATDSGFNKELKPFRPHLTLGRIKYLTDKTTFFSLVDKLAEVDYQSFPVSEFILYQSILRPEGPEYKIIRKFELVPLP